MNIAVIPARGGSKRIPRKNIRNFYGKPMIAYAIEVAHAAGIFEHIIVSSDDKEIINVAKTYGAEAPFVRPALLSDDFTPTVPVISHTIQSCLYLGWQIEYVCCIYPTAPFVLADDLHKAYKIMCQTKKGYVFPVTAFPSHIQRGLKLLDNNSVEPFYPEFANTRTQDLEMAYYDVGQFYWGNIDAWIHGHAIHPNGHSLIIPEWRAVDIDTLSDWERAEKLFPIFLDENKKIK